jgi:hypothetical protein
VPEKPFQQIRHPKKRAFLLGVAIDTNRARAAKAADIDRSLHYHWLKTDAAYAEAYKVAHRMGAEALEDRATERAMDDRDVLLIFRLKSEMPEKYRERWDGQLSGPGGGPLLSDAQVRKLLEENAPPDGG